jgi:hypothetical protein
MRKSRIPMILALPAAILLASAGVRAQETEQVDVVVVQNTSPTNTSSRDRLYINFIEDAMIVDEQWWEGWLQYDEADNIDGTVLYGRAAFQPWENVEVGGSFGFGETNSSSSLPDGMGATDLNLWGKYYWNLGDQKTELTAGGVLTVPTGDNEVGLGWDAFALKGFGAIRYRLKPVVLTGTFGLQTNADGQVFNSGTLDGNLSVDLGIGVIAPWSESFSWIGELTWNSERFDGTDDNSQLLGGINLRLSNRGMLRPALAFGLQDGAPNLEVIVGYAYSF